MQIPDIPVDEARRLTALHATRLLGSAPEEAFDRITRMAARLLNAPTALVSLVDKDVQWFKSRCGFESAETARDISFCGHAILDREPLVVGDATKDERFATTRWCWASRTCASTPGCRCTRSTACQSGPCVCSTACRAGSRRPTWTCCATLRAWWSS
jgi:GAF domain-containing protein